MPAQSFQPQSIGKRQLNIRKGEFTAIDVTAAADPAAPPLAGRVCHVGTAGLKLGYVPGKLPCFAFTGADELVSARPDPGMMPGGKIKAFRHNAPVELATTEFIGLTTEAEGTALTSADAAADGAANSGKLRVATATEPVVAYLTRKSYKSSEGQTMIDFIPAYVKGVYA
jgi:hypothetical protein